MNRAKYVMSGEDGAFKIEDIVWILGIYSKKPPHFNEEMNCYLALYVQDILL